VQFDGLKLSAAILAEKKGKFDCTDIHNVINDGKIVCVFGKLVTTTIICGR